jgi:multidrug resistance efflux pump
MSSENNKKDIELYSENVQEILGSPPKWILAWGMTVLLLIIIVLFIGSWIFKYPDIVVSTITVTNENIPVNLVAKSTGKITGLFASDNQLVEKGRIVAVIENAAVTNDVIKLKESLAEYDSCNWLNEASYSKINFPSSSFGEIESSFSQFRSKLEDYIKFTSRDVSGKKVAGLQNQIKYYKSLIVQLKRQVALQTEDLELAKVRYKRDSGLYLQKVISQSDIEGSGMNFLEKKFTVESARTSLTNSQILQSQLEQQVLDLKLDRSTKEAEYDVSLRQLLSNLKASIAKWEQEYVLISPVDGRLTFSRVWSLNQNVITGELVVTIVPSEKGDIIGILKLPVTGSGKVKKGMKVNIRFSNYPYMEFGMVIGKIEKISLAPDEKYYLAEVRFPDGLVTNYGKQLSFLGEMTGSAEVITEDMRLIQRIFNPVKSLLKEHL